MKKERSMVHNLIIVTLGIAIYSFGFIKFNMANHLAEGGIAGVTLIFKALFDINPAYSNFILNIPLVIIMARTLGRRSLLFYCVRHFLLISIYFYLAENSDFS